MPPLFMLENQDQWYPPGFLILCALLPQRWLQNRFWILNHLIDLGPALLIFICALQWGAPLYAATGVMIIYGVMPGLTNEFSVLNARPFGLFLFNAFLLTTAAAIGEPAFITGTIVLAACLFFSHKLSIQQLWFTLPVLTAATGEWIWLGAFAAIYMLPFVIWPRGAWRILRGHFVIVRFWHRNWRLLGAHSVRQSPVYGDGETRTNYYANGGPAHPVRFLKDALHQNYFIAPVAIAVAVGASWTHSILGIVLITWVASVYIWTFAIHFIKPLRSIGLAQQYIKFALVPSLIGVSLSFVDPVNWWVAGLAILATLATTRQYILITRSMWRGEASATTKGDDTDLNQMMDVISKDTDARIMCLPVHLCDLVAYQSRKPVYWGTHSDVFDDRLEAFFPVLKHDLQYYIRDGANRLLLDTNYLRPTEIGLDPQEADAHVGRYYLFNLSDG